MSKSPILNETTKGTILSLRFTWWVLCCGAGRDCGLMQDGHYDRQTDLDFVLMCCGAGATL